MVEVVHQRGSVADLHALDPFARDPFGGDRSGDTAAGAAPAIWWCDPTDAAVVLGARHRAELVDAVAVAAAGLGIARRRSGGGAVLVDPAAVVWIDVVLPHGLAPDDVRTSMVWVGECWASALGALMADRGVAGELAVHRGGMVATPWSDLVCFAGLGPGEVVVGGRKLVGLSQRRTSAGVRVQGMVHRTPLTTRLARLFAVARPAAPLDEPASLAWLEGAPTAAALAAAVARAVAAGGDPRPG